MSISGARRFVLQIGPLKFLLFLALFCSAGSSRIGRTDAAAGPRVGGAIGPLKSLRFRRMALFCRAADWPRINRANVVEKRPRPVAWLAH